MRTGVVKQQQVKPKIPGLKTPHNKLFVAFPCAGILIYWRLEQKTIGMTLSKIFLGTRSWVKKTLPKKPSVTFPCRHTSSNLSRNKRPVLKKGGLAELFLHRGSEDFEENSSRGGPYLGKPMMSRSRPKRELVRNSQKKETSVIFCE